MYARRVCMLRLEGCMSSSSRGVCQTMTTRIVRLAVLAILASAPAARAQGVAFTTTSLPRALRQVGITETAGELVLTALNFGSIKAGSTIDLVYSVPVTNNSTLSTNNISVANNIFCFPSSICPTSATQLGSQTVRLFFASDTSFSPGDQINISRVRVSASQAAGSTVSLTILAASSNPATNPISFTEPTRTVGILNQTITLTANPGGAAVKSIPTCAFTQGTPFSVRLNEVFAAALT